MFQSQGVPEFWIVDVYARIIERWRPTDSRPEVLTGSLTWPPPFEIPPLVIDLDAQFAEVWEEDPPGET